MPYYCKIYWIVIKSSAVSKYSCLHTSVITYFFVIITHRPSQELDTQPLATSVTSDNFPFLWSFTMSPFLCTRIQLTAVPSILCTISLIHIAAYESRQNLSCFAVQQTKQKIAAVASDAVSFIMANFLLNVLFHIEWQMWILFCYFIWILFCNLDTV